MAYIILFLTTLFTGCHSSYTVFEKKSGFLEVKNETEDESINKMIQPYRDSLSGEMETVIGISEMEMKTGQPESLLGNFVCELMILYNKKTWEEGNNVNYPTVALMNQRGLRAPLPKGEIKIKHIFEIMPFENTVNLVSLKGKVILLMAKFLAENGGHPISSNFKMTVEQDKSFSVTIDGIPIDTNGIYTVITTDYLFEGGDNMNFFKDYVSKTETQYKFRDLLIDMITYYSSEGLKITSQLDGRITFK
jgi:2',3'-cyclic-nucleotide 2'-phosphodiesterase (5'-nucleotidase family)